MPPTLGRPRALAVVASQRREKAAPNPGNTSVGRNPRANPPMPASKQAHTRPPPTHSRVAADQLAEAEAALQAGLAAADAGVVHRTDVAVAGSLVGVAQAALAPAVAEAKAMCAARTKRAPTSDGGKQVRTELTREVEPQRIAVRLARQRARQDADALARRGEVSGDELRAALAGVDAAAVAADAEIDAAIDSAVARLTAPLA